MCEDLIRAINVRRLGSPQKKTRNLFRNYIFIQTFFSLSTQLKNEINEIDELFETADAEITEFAQRIDAQTKRWAEIQASSVSLFNFFG